jgi:hypothetical protein
VTENGKHKEMDPMLALRWLTQTAREISSAMHQADGIQNFIVSAVENEKIIEALLQRKRT